ncbi:mechanosensitive ion channel family protein [Desulforhopalus singaporensis]|uniref:Small-conductance mechanosensitive channel n=1 Tax=Desulforhopalus singaporensis TaxID=91360 RepID=A0A1H0M5I8_9BACT|nr:mechanosensitive ion channel family protein [Desulforhopalus singaporensis]SDO75693.1 Small-conductance mechanosensitive channel [Desulforhopalus singaporensis]
MQKATLFFYQLILTFILLLGCATGGGAAQDAAVTDRIRTLVADLDDTEVRQLLEELQQDTAASRQPADGATTTVGPPPSATRVLSLFESEFLESDNRLRALFKAIPGVSDDLYRTLLTLSSSGTVRGIYVNMLWIVFFISAGFAVEQIGRRMLFYGRFRINREELDPHLPKGKRLQASVIHILPDLICLVIFFGISCLSFTLFGPTQNTPVYLTFLALLLTITSTRAIYSGSLILFAPDVPEFRFVTLKSKTARAWSNITTVAAGYMISVLMFLALIQKLGAGEKTVQLLYLGFATLLLGAIGASCIVYRTKVKKHLFSSDQKNKETLWVLEQLGAVWHILALLYLALLWVLLVNSITLPQNGTRAAFMFSVFAFPLWLAGDRIVQRVVLYGVTLLKIHQEQYQESADTEEIVRQREDGKKIYLRIRKYARTGLAAIVAILLAGLWDFRIPFISRLAAIALDSLIIIAIALTCWHLINTWIAKRLQDSLVEEESAVDDEWGAGPPKGRAETLLPIIRKFVAIALTVMVTMTILSATGINIGPLLAGAGVIGLAVGFGAQKLVSDILSGFFYLLDDSFRVGEYLTAGSVSGTVESITLRNLMLRHHRGMLQIIPHSELGAITNYMRGGIVVKFNLDFPYDTDIDKVRKIIKKVGIAMLDDEEMGKDFIRPVKSQGVREITNSVMTIRVKFTAKPGSHFVIRREAFKRITEALQAKGIEYAHRKVIVDIPGLDNADKVSSLSGETREKIINGAGAAAFAKSGPDQKQQPQQLRHGDKAVF